MLRIPHYRFNSLELSGRGRDVKGFIRVDQVLRFVPDARHCVGHRMPELDLFGVLWKGVFDLSDNVAHPSVLQRLIGHDLLAAPQHTNVVVELAFTGVRQFHDCTGTKSS